MFFPTSQQANLPACSAHCQIHTEHKNYKFWGNGGVGIEPESAVSEAAVITTRRLRSELNLVHIWPFLNFIENGAKQTCSKKLKLH